MKAHLQNPAADERNVEGASMVYLINIFEIHIEDILSIEVVISHTHMYHVLWIFC